MNIYGISKHKYYSETTKGKQKRPFTEPRTGIYVQPDEYIDCKTPMKNVLWSFCVIVDDIIKFLIFKSPSKYPYFFSSTDTTPINRYYVCLCLLVYVCHLFAKLVA